MLAAVLLMAARPGGETVLLLKLNGQPAWIGTSVPGIDGGTVAVIDAGAGEVVKTICHSAACICPGQSCVCPSATNLANFSNPNVGEKLTAEVAHFMVLADFPTANSGRISTSNYAGSTGPDGGSGAWCDHWIMR